MRQPEKSMGLPRLHTNEAIPSCAFELDACVPIGSLTNEWRCREDHHGKLQLVASKHVTNGSPSDPGRGLGQIRLVQWRNTLETYDRKALPATPSRNLATSMVSMFLATAHGMSHIMKKTNDTLLGN